MNIFTINPILVMFARVVLIGSAVCLGFIGVALLEGERIKKLAEWISNERRRAK